MFVVLFYIYSNMLNIYLFNVLFEKLHKFFFELKNNCCFALNVLNLWDL